jgi:hypothetical protein
MCIARNFMFPIVTKYYWGVQIRQKEMGVSCDTVWGKRNARTALVGKAERERPLGRPRHRCKDINNRKHGSEVKTGGVEHDVPVFRDRGLKHRYEKLEFSTW